MAEPKRRHSDKRQGGRCKKTTVEERGAKGNNRLFGFAASNAEVVSAVLRYVKRPIAGKGAGLVVYVFMHGNAPTPSSLVQASVGERQDEHGLSRECAREYT